jgi:hypothetical protein
LEDPGEHGRLVHAVAGEEVLLGLRGDADLLDVGAQERRLAHVAAGEGDDRGGHRGAEQQGLPVRGGRLDELLDVGQEPEVEHLVGLVEDEGRSPSTGRAPRGA